MTRRLTFSAAQSDWVPAWSETENLRVFGSDAQPLPHGHNYGLDVSVAGEIDAKTGIIVNIKTIDAIVKERVIQVLDGKFLNEQIPVFRNQPASPENLTAFIVNELRDAMPQGAALTAIRLEETPLHWVEWRASDNTRSMGARTEKREGNATMRMTRVYEFAASHRLDSPHLSETENRELFGKCNYPYGHGHNYTLEVTVAGPVDEKTGRVMDERDLDAIVNKEVVDRYDHRHLNYEIPEFQTQIPSSEVVTQTIFERLAPHISAPVRLDRIVVRETARNIFEYSGKDEVVA